MKKQLYHLILFVLAIVVVSCSGSNKLTTTEEINPAEKKVQPDELSEKEQMEFQYRFIEALKQKMQGNAQNAIQILSSCLEIDPNSSAAMYELAQIHAANNDLTSASLLLEKAITINDNNVWYKQLLAQIYQQQRKYDKAADLYTRLLEKDPDNLEFLYSKAILLSSAQKFDEAIKIYDQLEKKTGINEQISVAKQQLYVMNGQTNKAFDEINRLIDYNPGESKYYGLLADLYLSEGDSVNALKNYKKILEMDPESGFVHFSLANYYLSQNELEKSFQETVKGFSSESVDLHTKLQLYMVLVSNREQSKLTEENEEKLIKILLEKHPDEYLVYTVYADYFLRKNDLKNGRDQILKALDIQNNDYALWERVLFIDNDLQDWNGLYEHSQNAAELFPNQPQVYFMHAIACIQLEKYDEAVKISDEGLDYVVDNPQLRGQFLMLKGEGEYKQNKTEEAYKLFDESIKLDPDNYIAMNNYAYYLSLSGRDLDKAERMSGKVVEKYPDNSTYLDTHAWVLFKKGEYKLAKFYMDSALKYGGEDNATLLEHYGDILIMLNKPEEANKYWEKAKLIGGGSEILERKIREQKYFEE